MISGVYFSEEIKDVLKIGYVISKIKVAKKFSKAYIFNDYVKEMYARKSRATGPERLVAKLLLNSLYGLFGRRQELLKTITINNSKLGFYLSNYLVISMIPVDDDRTTILFFNSRKCK